MPYRKTKYKAGKTAIYRYCYSIRYNNGERREKKKNPTSEAQRAVNIRKAAADLTVLLNANFGPADLYITCTFRIEDRPTEEEYPAIIRRFLDRVRTQAKKDGKELRYVWTAELGKRGAAHLHMVISHMDIRKIRDIWPYGYVQAKPLDRSGQYSKLAEYLVKYAERTWASIGKHIGRRYNPSRGLVRPKPEKKIVLGRMAIPEEIPVPKGWYLDKNTVKRGTHEITGYEYLEYILVKIEAG